MATVIARGRAEHGEGGAEPGGFTHALRQRHHPTAVVRQHNRQLELANHVEYPVCRTGIRIDQALSWAEWNAQVPEPRHKTCGMGGARIGRVAGAWKVDHSPVLGDHGIDEVEIAGNAADLIQNAASHEDDRHVALPRIRERSEHGCIRTVVARERPVVVQCHTPIS